MTFPYAVQRGDTLCRIAQRYGIDLPRLCAANSGLSEQSTLYPGQVLQIPASQEMRYVAQAGEPLRDMARDSSLPDSELMAANPGTYPDSLHVGQTMIILPGRENAVAQPFNVYGYTEMMEQLERLQQAYPFLTVESIGSSVLGKRIPAVRIGAGPREIHYNGSFHANEWITSMLLMKFLEDYASAFANSSQFRAYDARSLFEQTVLWIVPMVNPDGVELAVRGVTKENPYFDRLIEWNGGSTDFTGWKANLRGIDLNDQFPAGWEIERDRRAVSGPAPRDFTGYAPLTEPEALAMADFTLRHDFRLVVAFHTQGREIYWNYGNLEPPEAEAMAKRLAEVSGYEAVKLTGSDAGYKDWFIQAFRRPGFTVEAGLGVNPLPISQFEEIYDEVAPLMLEGLSLAQVN